jgi:hypothetical protein
MLKTPEHPYRVLGFICFPRFFSFKANLLRKWGLGLLHWGSCNRQSNGFPICRKRLETILFERIGVFQMLSWFSEWVKILWAFAQCKIKHLVKIYISWETCQDYTTWNQDDLFILAQVKFMFSNNTRKQLTKYPSCFGIC